ncbi:MAG: hypothetical protein HC886_14815 [Leptolyngbyaceae cyanobacterium SM1_1_3]|nr:hypothetical protein [Leptolyngbyaceae cyanobacterium SM1_1_3]NJN03759.1 hypothetical protein [Leptolyngbyaceae cyanobacterium RM1_1_2]NJO08522.1 hypothetical protein [Leptolyngbyaceae cyanobacterium SL_1_1]
MTPDDITRDLEQRFGDRLQILPPDAWQVETDNFRLLVLLSKDLSWLRSLIPIGPQAQAEPYMAQILAANFDYTQEVRYAFYETVLWGVFQHDRAALTLESFQAATERLLALKQAGLDAFFNDLVEGQIRQIIQAAKLQGQTLEDTMQTLERFYAEGVMGELSMGKDSRQNTLEAWQRQLERLWPDVEIPQSN